MNMSLTLYMLLLTSIPFPFIYIPTSVIQLPLWLYLLLRLSLHDKSYYSVVSILSIFLFISISFLSPHHDLLSLLLIIFRIISSFIPILVLPLLLSSKTFIKFQFRPFVLASIIFILLVYSSQAAFLIFTPCVNAYGSFCLLGDPSTSVASLLYFSLMISSFFLFLKISWSKSSKIGFPAYQKLFVSLLTFLVFLSSLISGLFSSSRLFYVLIVLFAIIYSLISLVSLFFRRHLVFHLWLSKRLLLSGFFISILVLQLFLFISQSSIFVRLLNLLENPWADVRFQENFFFGGNIFFSKDFDYLLGNGAFSRFLDPYSPMTYDSVVTFIFGDYGSVGVLVLLSLFLFASLKLYKNLSSVEKDKPSFRFFPIVLYLTYFSACFSNEFLFIDTVNGLFASIFLISFKLLY